MKLGTRIKLFFMPEDKLLEYWKHEVYSRAGRHPKGEVSRENGRKGGRPRKKGQLDLPIED